MAKPIDPKVRELAERVIAGGKPKRAVLALKALLEKGSISTDELQAIGYGHPPRVIGDIRDAGIPIITGSDTAAGGNRMAVYSLGDSSQIQEGRIGGRSAFPKAFKLALIKRYGSIDCITGARLEPRVLQIDHRIPYRVAGDAGLGELDVEAYMLLDGSSQRSKSFSCENCPNMIAREVVVCKTCFWAFPDNYEHIATEPIRRTDIVWQGNEVSLHDRLKAEAERQNLTMNELVKKIARQKAKDL